MNRKTALAILTLIFFTGVFLRFYPPTQFNKPLRYDAYYHVRVAEHMKDTGEIWMTQEPWPQGGRPHIYPPIYHWILVGMSIVTGASVLTVTRFFLPLISSLLIIGFYWLLEKYRDRLTGLLAAGFIALNPVLISNSYGSPEIIGMLLSIFAVNFMLKEKYWETGITLSVIYLFNTFSALVITLPIGLFLFIYKRDKDAWRVVLPLVVIVGGWYLLNLGSLYAMNNYVGPHFLQKSLKGLMQSISVVMSLILLILLALYKKPEEGLTKFYWIWVGSFTVLFSSFLIIPYLHPWRQVFYLFIGLSILFSILLSSKKPMKRIITMLFLAGLLVGSMAMINPVNLKPALSEPDYEMIEWVDHNVKNKERVLGHHDVCSNLLTLTDNQCLMDISFESIERPQRWVDFEKFYFTTNSSKMKSTLGEYNVSYVLFGTINYNDKYLESLNLSRVYASWSCDETGWCYGSRGVYRRGLVK